MGETVGLWWIFGPILIAGVVALLIATRLRGPDEPSPERCEPPPRAYTGFLPATPPSLHAQADALEIEAQAKRRLADEYDAAQERGEVSTGRDGPGAGVSNGNAKVTAADVGLTRKAIHEARQIRDAERADPGVVRRTFDDRLSRGEEPSRTAGDAAPPSPPPAARQELIVSTHKHEVGGISFTTEIS